jgi:hypothetical protein
MDLSTFPAGGRVWLYFLDKPDLPFGGRELFWWCQRAVAIDHEHETNEEKNNEERLEESGGKARGF